MTDKHESASVRVAADNLTELLRIFPKNWQEGYFKLQRRADDLIEFVADLGRRPQARFQDGSDFLTKQEVSYADLDYVVSKVGMFGSDNRAGLNAALHRISAIRSRSGRIVGLTARVGRAVYGDADIIRDIMKTGRSILLLGRPGVGKTTVLREMSRVLADEMHKRVVIVDTSNEIAGDGDIPHSGVGSARRLQVPEPALQHNVMIEAVENHTPEVVVIDEISTEAEAYAARTIAERGVMLVATAHGIKLENLVRNPTLCDLVGGIESVTLSDEIAFKRAGGHKAILERKAPPTFDVVIELRDRNTFVIHKQVSAAVDAILRGAETSPIVRTRNAAKADDSCGLEDKKNALMHEKLLPERAESFALTAPAGRRKKKNTKAEAAESEEELKSEEDKAKEKAFLSRSGFKLVPKKKETAAEEPASDLEKRFAHLRSDRYADDAGNVLLAQTEREPVYGRSVLTGIFAVGISRNRLERLIRLMELPARVCDSWKEAELAAAADGAEKSDEALFSTLHKNGMPVYFVKDKSWTRIKEFLEEYFDSAVFTDEELAQLDAHEAVAEVLNTRRPVNLLPQPKQLRTMQRRIASSAGVDAVSFGTDPECYVRLSLNGRTAKR